LLSDIHAMCSQTVNTHLSFDRRLCVINVPRRFFFFNDTATTEIYTLSLHDALPILNRPREGRGAGAEPGADGGRGQPAARGRALDRKSTRLNSSHVAISYAVFCLKKKKIRPHTTRRHYRAGVKPLGSRLCSSMRVRP